MNPSFSSQKAILGKPWLRRLVWVVAALLTLWLLGWLGVPPLLKSQLQSRLGEQLGRAVTVGAVDFKPWTLELTVSDLVVARAQVPAPGIALNGTLPQLAFKRLYVDMELQSLLRLAPVVNALTLDALALNLTYIGDGHYDTDDVLAKFAAQPEGKESAPLHYALYNLVLSNAAVTFTDTPHKQVHRLNQVNLSLPFLSNLDSKREVLVSPKLSFNLNGSAFDSAADATPFAQTREAEAQLRFKDLDLAPYLTYLPATLPVRLQSAILEADLKLSFKQEDKASMVLTGQVAAKGVLLTAAPKGGTAAQSSAAELLRFDRLAIDLGDVQPLEQKVDLGRIELTAPHLMVRRDRAGVLNLLALAKPGNTKNAPENKAISASDAIAAGKKDAEPSVAAVDQPWRLQVQDIIVSKGEIVWLDQVPTPAVRQSLNDLTLQAHTLTWPMTQPVALEGSAQLATAHVNFRGQATDQAADVTVSLTGLPLRVATPYLRDVLTPRLEGTLAAELGVQWTAAQAGKPSQTLLTAASLDLDKLALVGKQKPALASVARVRLQDATLDLGRQSVVLGKLQVTEPKASISRAPEGRWMFQDWLKTPPARSPTRVPDSDKQAKPSWKLTLKELQVADGAFGFADEAVRPAVALEISRLALQVKDFASDGKKPFAVTLAARARHGHTEPGRLTWRGSTVLTPMALKGDLSATRLPLQALAPYISDVLNVSVLRADSSFKGRINLALGAAAATVAVAGDAALEDLQVQTLAQAEPLRPAEELLNWKSLNLTGLTVALAPGAAPKVDVAGTVLSDFYARVILSEAGRLNLQDLTKPAASTESAATGASGASAPEAVASAPELVASSAPVALIHFGPVSLVGGHVNFTDRFIKPNYSANLTQLVGKLSALSSEPVNGAVELADLALRGRAQGTATLEVLGKVNPLVQPMVLDITGKVRDLELAPLSTYSARYAGYGIERGKLSVNVAYKVLPDGQLTTNNKLVLNQLKFGDKAPDATSSLPVKLAVVLLADRNGVIDIDLPVSGSLNDPQFRLMPIVFKIIGNLIVKAITAPFSLLASALGGGGDELSMVSFEPGSAVLSDAAKASLAKVAKALQERPALKMTVVGTASLEVERDAYKRVQLQALVHAEKRRAASSAAAADQKPLPVTLTQEEYPALLKAVYKRADFLKPRNLIGMTKDAPVPDMEALLLAHLDASEAAIQALAVQRGVAVRDHLASLKLPMERLFLGAAKAVPPEAKWQPRAELNLATE